MTSETLPPLERRSASEPLRIEPASDGRPVITGYALKFNVQSELLPATTYRVRGGRVAFREMIAPGALARLRERRDVKALVGPDKNRVVGSTKSGTLQLTVDDVGLAYRLNPPDSPEGRNLLEAVKRGDIDGCSFGFRVKRDSWIDEQPPVRVIEDLELFEISPCAWPLYPDGGNAQIEQRALDHAADLAALHGREIRDRQIDALTRRLAALRR